MRTFAIALLSAVAAFASCNNDDDEPGSRSRILRYELTGTFSGTSIITAYTTASGGTVTEQITSLPWTKEITYESMVGGVSMVVSGAGGVAGEQSTLTIKRGGSQLGSPITATADARGAFTLSSPVITF